MASRMWSRCRGPLDGAESGRGEEGTAPPAKAHPPRGALTQAVPTDREQVRVFFRVLVRDNAARLFPEHPAEAGGAARPHRRRKVELLRGVCRLRMQSQNLDLLDCARWRHSSLTDIRPTSSMAQSFPGSFCSHTSSARERRLSEDAAAVLYRRYRAHWGAQRRKSAAVTPPKLGTRTRLQTAQSLPASAISASPKVQWLAVADKCRCTAPAPRTGTRHGSQPRVNSGGTLLPPAQ